jgi:hypothetical protein
MARVTCRCGEVLKLTTGDPDRLTCSRCGAKIRIRRSQSRRPASAKPQDGYVRFHCPCGRRLKVQSDERPQAGKCPDCGRVVPVPESVWETAAEDSTGSKGETQTRALARTQDMNAADLERLEQWASRYQATPKPDRQQGTQSTTSHQTTNATTPAAIGEDNPAPAMRMEAGLRVCPRCGKPLHMSATVCRSCGEPVSKR